ncbi:MULTISPECIES: peptidylprolyl isomerase [unclassified Arenibacter]|uniref:FKBP-type peptidyl-prolyl cis-trans isomerase n=1 Tax=unclassified Arenibacter TaxID=2615047 RepID=UPI000E355815|nr:MULTISPECIES: peptidylprolyl isomerase [unclassified Arenibacter]MCM4163214.1 peptidylprolyl isomerase [Arenibacter sp. A80]RFT57237.1 peptidylprolyl isomerase [Arenibacter sp. P308M17]
MGRVKENDTVKVHYTGKLNNGQIFDSSLERDPIEVTLGQGQLIPGFEKELVNMEVNEKKTINVPKEEAYGDIMEELFHEINRKELPEDIKPEIGMMLMAKNPDGTENQLRITDVKEETIVIDANHVLAGQDLTFELELVAIL